MLAKRGFKLRIAETAFLEWIAACVRGWQHDGWSRHEARRKFFGRAKSVAPFLDVETPIALDGGMLTRRVVAEVDGHPRFQEADARQHQLGDLWGQIVGVGMTDEEFSEAGGQANEFLDDLDDSFAALARREEELRTNPLRLPTWTLPSSRTAMHSGTPCPSRSS